MRTFISESGKEFVVNMPPDFPERSYADYPGLSGGPGGNAGEPAEGAPPPPFLPYTRLNMSTGVGRGLLP